MAAAVACSMRQVNGAEVAQFLKTPQNWYGITVTNNIIANNVAGWDGGGVSMQDAFKITFTNNTVASNDTTASAGVLFKTLGAIDASSPPPGCLPTPDPSQPQNPNCMLPNAPHIPQPAGLVTQQNTPNMMSQLPSGVVCPAGFGYGNAADTTSTRTNGRCVLVSLPRISNDLFWQNRAFHVEIVDQNGNPINGTSTPNGQGNQSHQNIVALLPMFTQNYTGQCVTPPAGQELYWDLGVRMDLLPNQNGHALNFNTATVGAGSYDTANGGSGVTANLNDAGPIGLPASYSIFSDSLNAANVNPVGSVGNVAPSKTPVIGQYCNGARVPPEQCATNQGANDPGMCKGYFTPAGQSETVGVAPVFVFNGIQASATVDEGNNWINMTYGPLSLGRPPVSAAGSTASAEPTVGSAAVGIAQGAYSIASDSAAVGAGSAAAPGTPNHDFYGQTRSTSGVSIGAVELAVPAPTLTAISPNAGAQGTSVAVTLTGTNFTAGSNVVISGSGINQFGATFTATSITTNFVIAGNATLGARTVTVSTSGGTTAPVTFTVVAKPPAPTLTSITPNTGTRGNTVAVTLVGTNFSAAGLAVNVSGSGVTATNVTYVDATHVTANLVVDANASLNNGGARNVTVTTAGGTSGSRTFTISNPPTATLTSISPTSGTHGTTVNVTFTGTNFTTAGSSINISGTGVTPTITSATPTQLVVSFVITSGAATGSRFVSVTTPRNTTATKTFTVN